MTTKHRISAVAERTGFSTSTLRYYESIGLVVPGRAESGYREYDDGDVQFLTFAARAKRMGLSLEAITELGELWKQQRCAPVASRLHDLVGERAASVRARSEELDTFHTELQRLLAGIDPMSASDDPCGDDCGCNPTAASNRSTAMRMLPLVHVEPVIACTLDAGASADRIAEWRSLVSEAVIREDRPGWAKLSFPGGSDQAMRVATLAIAEQDCCQFLEFTMTMNADGTTLVVRAPDGAEEMLEAIIGSGDEARTRT